MLCALILLLLFGGITTTTCANSRTKSAYTGTTACQKLKASPPLVSFQSADPYEGYDTIPGKDLTLEEFLFQSLPAIREDLANQPEVQLEMLEIMSKLYNRLSMKKEGYELSKEVLDSTRNHLGSHSPKYADGLFILAGAAADLEKFVEADSLFQLALTANREVYGFRPKHLSVVYNDYGIMAYTQGKSVLADSLYRESLRIMRINQIPDTANYAQTLSNHAQALQALGKVEEAYYATLKAVKILPLAGLDKTLYMAHTYHRLAGLLLAKDSIESAIDYQQKALDGFKNYLGPRDHFYALGLYQLAKIQEAQRDYSAQEKSLMESADIIAEIYGTQNRNYAAILSALGTSMHRQGKYEEAIRWQNQALETFEGVRDSAKAAVTLLKIASSMIFEEEFDEARLAI
ncbi:MAG: tetratricopeptide repeat protein [Bacteroidia bacterium]